VLFVSHNMAAVQSLCGKGILLEDGRLSVMSNVKIALDSYFRNKQLANFKFDISEMPRRFSNGMLDLKSVILMTIEDEVKNTFCFGECFKVKTSMMVHEKMSDFILRFIVSDSNGNNLFTLSGIDKQGFILHSLNIGEACFETLIDIRFLPGTFELSIQALTLDGTPLDWVDNAVQFTIFSYSKDNKFNFVWEVVNGGAELNVRNSLQF